MVERVLASIEGLLCVRYTLHTLSHLTLTITRDVGIILLTLNVKMRHREAKQLSEVTQPKCDRAKFEPDLIESKGHMPMMSTVFIVLFTTDTILCKSKLTNFEIKALTN